jgi:hypothetical protein
MTFITVTTNSRHRTHILRFDITLMTYQVRIPARNLLSWLINFSVFHYFLWKNIRAIYYNKPRPFFNSHRSIIVSIIIYFIRRHVTTLWTLKPFSYYRT